MIFIEPDHERLLDLLGTCTPVTIAKWLDRSEHTAALR